MKPEQLESVPKLQWAAKMLCLVAGVAMLMGFIMVSARAGLYPDYPGHWWVLFSISIIYIVISIAAWRFQMAGGIIVMLVSTAMIIYSTLSIVSNIWYDYRLSFYNSDFWWVYINLALDISVAFLISGILHVVSGYLKNKKREAPLEEE